MSSSQALLFPYKAALGGVAFPTVAWSGGGASTNAVNDGGTRGNASAPSRASTPNSVTATVAAAVPPAGGKDEATWLPAARRGDPQALSQFYTAYYPLVWSLCRRLLRSEADAEDALQTTFVRAFAALPKFRGEGSVKTWLYRIALNEAMTQLRRRAAGPGITVPLDEERDEAGNGFGSEFSPASPTSGATIAENVAVRALLESMKPEYRTILVLRFWEDLAYEEIAEVTGLSLSNVKMRLHRAKEEFRRLYEGGDDRAEVGRGGLR